MDSKPKRAVMIQIDITCFINKCVSYILLLHCKPKKASHIKSLSVGLMILMCFLSVALMQFSKSASFTKPLSI